MKKKTLLVLLGIVAVLALASAQAKTSLNIQCNLTGAKVYINDKLAGYTNPNFSLLVVPGTYTVKVVKDGYPEYKRTVEVGSSPVTLTVTLGGSGAGPVQPPNPPQPPQPPVPPPPPPKPPVVKHQLTVDANVKGANVYVNDSFVGVTPFNGKLEHGTYSVSVRMEGYENYNTSFRLDGSYRVYAVLEPRPVYIYIDAYNVPIASVFRDSVYMGTTPYRGAWPQGNYAIRIAASGYQDFVDQMAIRSPLNLSVFLEPLPSVEYEIRLPPSFGMTGGDRPLSFQDYQVFLDGSYLMSPTGTMRTGTHRLEIRLGALRFETSFEILQGGKAVIEPFLGVKIY
ncbi:MAG TPA: PEGA domain-containing protein [Rectinemataceae bacterium]